MGVGSLLCIVWRRPEDWVPGCCSNCKVWRKTLPWTSHQSAALQQHMLQLWWVNTILLHCGLWKCLAYSLNTNYINNQLRGSCRLHPSFRQAGQPTSPLQWSKNVNNSYLFQTSPSLLEGRMSALVLWTLLRSWVLTPSTMKYQTASRLSATSQLKSLVHSEQPLVSLRGNGYCKIWGGVTWWTNAMYSAKNWS